MSLQLFAGSRMASYLVDSLSSKQVEELAEGVNFIGRRLIVFKQGNRYRACRNVCRHQGGSFCRHGSYTVECVRHGWILDCAEMRYVNPSGLLAQEEYRAEVQTDGGLHFYAEKPSEPWGEAAPKEEINQGELTITFMAHACMILNAGGIRIATDPWLTGPAFLRGWWLQHAPPADWVERLAAVDAIFISHGHSDHLNLPTLFRLAQVNPNLQIYVPKLVPEVWSGEFRNLPFKVTEVEVDVWSQYGPLRMMYLRDSLSPDLDTAMLFEYRGHRILNTVDCNRPNGNHLPEVDVLLSDFASGASGYPTCFAEMYGDEIPAMVQKKRRMFLQKTLTVVDSVKPKAFIPFAGYFVEAHPLDQDVRKLNVKNDPEAVVNYVKARGIVGWKPHPGGVFDVASLEGTHGEFSPPDWNFEEFDTQIAQSMQFPPLQNIDGVRRYFEWAAFRDYELVLHIIETNGETAVREYFVDFRNLSFPSTAPSNVPLIRAKIRADSLRHVMQHGLSWDVIYIGFQGRFVVSPDVYHMKFWNHFARLEGRPRIIWD